jgi:hypothetical protein
MRNRRARATRLRTPRGLNQWVTICSPNEFYALSSRVDSHVSPGRPVVANADIGLPPPKVLVRALLWSGRFASCFLLPDFYRVEFGLDLLTLRGSAVSSRRVIGSTHPFLDEILYPSRAIGFDLFPTRLPGRIFPVEIEPSDGYFAVAPFGASCNSAKDALARISGL